jgi:hypothetical protein
VLGDLRNYCVCRYVVFHKENPLYAILPSSDLPAVEFSDFLVISRMRSRPRSLLLLSNQHTDVASISV